ncbi:hypothetical protein, partial [Thiolapillus sp.]
AGITVKRVLAHGLVGGAFARARGDSFGSGFATGVFTKLSAGKLSESIPGKFGGAAASAIIGGTASTLSGGKFANGALSGAFGYLFGSAMAANDDSYGQNEMAMISQDKWSYIMSRSPRLSGLYDDADHFDVEYFDPRAISETGPTWENFGEYVADVGPYFIGGGSGGLVISGGRALLYRALSSPRIGHRLFTATRKNGVWNTGKLRFGWSGKNGSDVYHLMFRYKQHHIPTGIRITRPHPNP